MYTDHVTVQHKNLVTTGHEWAVIYGYYIAATAATFSVFEGHSLIASSQHSQAFSNGILSYIFAAVDKISTDKAHCRVPLQ